MEMNRPALWRHRMPEPKADGHKYDRGHAVVFGGPKAQTGAARLAARAALRMGAGLVSIACDEAALPIYAVACEAVMVRSAETAQDFAELIGDERIHAVLLGPNAGHTARVKQCIAVALTNKKTTLLDADALTLHEHDASELFGQIAGPTILTPHAGEYARLFGALPEEESARMASLKQAVLQSGATILLKGARTLIAAPDGRLVCNDHATPYLATAGAGDVLGGMILGLLAQGMPMFEAACAAAWMHGEAGHIFGPGLIAEDLPDLLPKILRHVLAQNH